MRKTYDPKQIHVKAIQSVQQAGEERPGEGLPAVANLAEHRGADHLPVLGTGGDSKQITSVRLNSQ